MDKQDARMIMTTLLVSPTSNASCQRLSGRKLTPNFRIEPAHVTVYDLSDLCFSGQRCFLHLAPYFHLFDLVVVWKVVVYVNLPRWVVVGEGMESSGAVSSSALPVHLRLGLVALFQRVHVVLVVCDHLHLPDGP